MLRLLSPHPSVLPSRTAVGVPESTRPRTGIQSQDGPSNHSISAGRSRIHASHSTHMHDTNSSRSSVASYGRYEIPHLTKTPWELERHKRHSAWRRSRIEQQFSAHIFKKLPREVYDNIVVQLARLHLEQDQTCPSCYLTDLYNLSLTSRAWDRAVAPRMYRQILLLGNEGQHKMLKLKIPGTGRLKLLRRTLRERPALARYVRELHMPDFQALYYSATIEREEIVNLVASLVMACPNLERLVGFHIPYTHAFDRLSHALSTRSELKERVWMLTDGEFELDEDDDSSPTNGYYHAACDPTERFLELNSNHSRLTMLVLHQEQIRSANELTFRAIIGTLRHFPALRHLSISGFSASSFTNLTLNALPANLESLRLENLAGVNDKGLQKFATSRLATSLQNITLVDLEVHQLTTVSCILSPHLAKLKHFSLSQHKAPRLPAGTDIPSLESSTIEYIHWELRSQAGPSPASMLAFAAEGSPSFPFINHEPISCLATTVLASNIRKGRFPSLRKIRAPHDPQGVLQELCKPLATAFLPSDSTFFTSPPRYTSAPSGASLIEFDRFSLNTASDKSRPSTAGCRTDSAMNSPMTGEFPCHIDGSSKSTFPPLQSTALTPSRSRLAAQSRILAARKEPFMTVQVTDPNGVLRVDKHIHGFLGDLKSKIMYDLRPDRNRLASGGSDDDRDEEAVNEWLTGIADIAGEWEVISKGGLGNCRHAASGVVGRKAVPVEDLFR